MKKLINILKGKSPTAYFIEETEDSDAKAVLQKKQDEKNKNKDSRVTQSETAVS